MRGNVSYRGSGIATATAAAAALAKHSRIRMRKAADRLARVATISVECLQI